MRTITDIRFWKSSNNTDKRIYITFSDGTEGCYYYTGNFYHGKGSLENMTEEEKHEAYEKCCSFYGIKGWRSLRYYQIHAEILAYNKENSAFVSRDEEDLDQEDTKKARSGYYRSSNIDMSYEG